MLGTKTSGAGFTLVTTNQEPVPPTCPFLSLTWDLTQEASLAALGESWTGRRSSVRSLLRLRKCVFPAGLGPHSPPPSPCFSPGLSAEFMTGGSAGPQFAGQRR